MTDEPTTMKQTADYPVVLESLVKRLSYRPGWKFGLKDIDRGQGSRGLTFCVTSVGYDTYNPHRGETYRVLHYFIVPAAGYNEQSWMIWLLDCLKKVEEHECNEFFQIDGERPFAPHHGPGNDPYVTFIHGEDIDRRTTFRGEVQPA